MLWLWIIHRAVWAVVTHPLAAADAPDQQRAHEQGWDEHSEVNIVDNRCELWGRH